MVVENIGYPPGIPEYPMTSPNGVVLIIPTEALSAEEIVKPWNVIQYQTRERISKFSTTCHALGDAPVWRTGRDCTGGKACQYTRYQDFAHNAITPSLDAQLIALKERVTTLTVEKRIVA